MSDIPGLTIRQHRRATFRQIVSPVAGVIRVLAGEKRVRHGGSELIARPGDFAIMPDSLPLVVENIPGPGGTYEAHAVVMGRRNAETAYAAMQAPLAAEVLAPAVSGRHVELVDCFERLCRDLAADTPVPEPLLDLRRQELAMRLATAGARLGPAVEQGIAGKLRQLIAADISGDWSAGRAAAALATSEPTLRRKLAAGGQSFQTLLADIRMTHALSLLQTTPWPVSRIAAETGYESQSRFAIRFRERFGLAPSEIRRSDAQNDRIGTKTDRIRRAS
ncbi:MAG: helix-turn-helix transcriptional regulator [Notoacmeibacter sp.]|nr:helix-turn-helix transcriptional regulator [Notoacmeibacter sp.]